MKFRKLPVEIDAVEWDGSLTTLDCLGFYSSPVSQNPGEKTLNIETLEAKNHIVNMGDWIIKGIKGELYSCRKDIFEATYEKVDQ